MHRMFCAAGTMVVTCLALTAWAQPPAPSAPPKAKPVTKKPSSPLRIEIGDDFVLTPSLQYLLRFRHHEGHDFNDGKVSDTLRHRARLGLAANYAGRVGAFVQLQDVRTWGEETNTLTDFSANGFDLHQGYAQVWPIDELELRFGRQEIAYENQRLIGTVGWLEQARSFDALRMSFRKHWVAVDGFYAKVAEHTSPTTDAGGNPFFADDIDLIAANLHLDPLAELSVGVVAVAVHNSISSRQLYTTGALVQIKPAKIVKGTLEGYYQTGASGGDVNHSAFFLGASARVSPELPGKPFFEVFGDFVSGDGNPNNSTNTSFDTLYATNHKFYGEMDFFLNLPKDTDQRGLRDTGVRVGAKPVKQLTLQATYHLMGAMSMPTEDLFGHELDFKLVLKPFKYFSWDAVYALFVPSDIPLQTIVDPVVEHFIYSTANVKF